MMNFDVRHFLPIKLAFLKADEKLSGHTSVKKLIENLSENKVNYPQSMLKFFIIVMYEKNKSSDQIDFTKEINANGQLSFNKLQ